MGEVKLFRIKRSISPFVCRVEIALKLKGVEYEVVEEELGNLSEELLKYNPVHKKVPVLVHNGKPISESSLILEYIDEVWKENALLLPSDPYERAQTRFWAKLIDEKILPSLRSALWGPEIQGKAQEELYGYLKALEDHIKAQNLIGSNKVGYLDIMGLFLGYWVPIAHEAKGNESILTSSDFPWIFSWVDGLLVLDPIKNVIPAKDDLLGYFRGRFATAK